MASKQHWETIYISKTADSVSWFQEHAGTSLQMIAGTGITSDGHIIDVGGGASTLADDLLSAGFTRVSVLDLSAAALQTAQARLGSKAAAATGITGDITQVELPDNRYDIWHDRAVFHFLVSPAERAAYKKTLGRSLKTGGHLILATFAEDGPEKCSGLSVQRYSVAELQAELGSDYALLHSKREQHTTPSQAIQNFNYCYFRKLT
jgi:ubiquinone/menaquinone biosynthesis C-methylase UbiE